MYKSLLAAVAIFFSCLSVCAEVYENHPAIETLFVENNIAGTIVLADKRTDQHWVYDLPRAQQRFAPASTFKLPHTLFALDAGILKDEFQFFTWDGIVRPVPAWNQHQNLRSAMRGSVVWVYQDFARKIGEARERKYLKRTQYGNQQTGGNLDQFWLSGKLAISAVEQVQFLQKLYRNDLPFKVEHQRLLKDVMVVQAEKTWILRAKTGWNNNEPLGIGWWIGWVEWPEGPVFFAFNMDMPNKAEDLPKREAITRQALEIIKALPASAPK